MEWTDEDVEAGCEAFRSVDPDGESEISVKEVRAIMTRAVELARLKPTEQVAEDERKIRSVFDHACVDGGEPTGKPCRACEVESGPLSRLAAAAQEREVLRAEVERLRPTGQVADDEEAVRNWLNRADNLAPLSVRSALARLAAEAQAREACCTLADSRLEQMERVAQEAATLRARVQEMEMESAEQYAEAVRINKMHDASQAEVERLKAEAREADRRWHATDQERLAWKARHGGAILERDEARRYGDCQEMEAKDQRARAVVAEARLADAVQERDAVRAEVERLKGLLDLAQRKTLADAERIGALESRFAGILERAKDDVQLTKVVLDNGGRTTGGKVRAVLDWVLEGDAPKEADEAKSMYEFSSPEAAVRWVHGDASKEEPKRYPCSPTCTHDDASTPGHLERVRERSEAFSEEAELAFNGCQNAREHICWAAGREAGLNESAEAMRAACWEAVDEVLESNGLAGPGRAPLYDAFKAAIEGATP